MKITFLGTGTSFGIPMVACKCPVCTSREPRNRRLRSSILVQYDGKNVLVDTSVDLRQQMLNTATERLDAILFTHAHADHIHGLDDVRRFNQVQKEPIKAYADRTTADTLRKVFFYIFEKSPLTTGLVPSIDLEVITGNFDLFGKKIVPLKILHYTLPILGYRIDDFAYVTDASAIPEETLAELAGLDCLVLNALRNEPHQAHFSLGEALEMAKKIKAKRTYFTHICHDLEHEATCRSLPEGVVLARDGLEIHTPAR